MAGALPSARPRIQNVYGSTRSPDCESRDEIDFRLAPLRTVKSKGVVGSLSGVTQKYAIHAAGARIARSSNVTKILPRLRIVEIHERLRTAGNGPDLPAVRFVTRDGPNADQAVGEE